MKNILYQKALYSSPEVSSIYSLDKSLYRFAITADVIAA